MLKTMLKIEPTARFCGRARTILFKLYNRRRISKLSPCRIRWNFNKRRVLYESIERFFSIAFSVRMFVV